MQEIVESRPVPVGEREQSSANAGRRRAISTEILVGPSLTPHQHNADGKGGGGVDESKRLQNAKTHHMARSPYHACSGGWFLSSIFKGIYLTMFCTSPVILRRSCGRLKSGFAIEQG